MRRLTAAVMLVIAMSGISAGPAVGSGDPGPFTILIDRRGGSPAEREKLYQGRMGILLTNASDSLLYLQWRLLNGLEVGSEVGATLTASCCDVSPGFGPDDAVAVWSKATALVPEVPPAPAWISTDLPGPDYTRTPNCFRDAFTTAVATLRDRVARYGDRDPAVRAWLTTQNAVFDACSRRDVALPPPMAGAPAWLSADRAYQEAAFALYSGRVADAFYRFRGIGWDKASPWHDKGLYLSVRALQRQAFAHPSPQTFAVARTGIARLAASPDAFGHGEVRGMLRALAYRDRPDALFKELDQELNAKAPAPDLAKSLRDYMSLSGRYTPRPEIADWLGTMRSRQREEALTHAQERWTATRKLSWLVAALTLVRTGDPQAATLAADAAAIPGNSPAWLTAQYHQMRLHFATSDPAGLRRRVDAILARDLSSSDRNIFLGLRTQLATSLPDMMRFAQRDVFCSEAREYCGENDWILTDGALARGPGGRLVTLGPDARAILDRLPLPVRMSVDADLPEALRLDLALTNFARAVLLEDNSAMDRLAGRLAVLLPQIRSDWLSIRRQRPGPDKRFSAFLVLAKIPGVAPDLVDNIRPQGTVRQWQGRWRDWIILPRGKTLGSIEPPAPERYNPWGYWAAGYSDDANGDIACYGYCGSGDFPLRLPQFAADGQGRARMERARFVSHPAEDKPVPAGTISAWQGLLDYARAHPRDPRSPEALYWLVRISRWGHLDDRGGYKAFRLLHTRYPGSSWTRRSPYYYD